MLEHDGVRQISTTMKIQAGAEQRGGSKSGESQESQLIRLQCQDDMVRVSPGSPRSPRRAFTTRLSSGSADREPSSSSYNASTGTFYSCISQITIGFDLGGQVAIEFSHWNSPFTESSSNLPSPDCVHSESSAVPPLGEHLEAVSCPASLSITPLPTCSASQDTICDSSTRASSFQGLGCYVIVFTEDTVFTVYTSKKGVLQQNENVDQQPNRILRFGKMCCCVMQCFFYPVCHERLSSVPWKI